VRAASPASAGSERPALPAGLAELIRREIPTLTDEIIREIQARIPEYARPPDHPYGLALRLGVTAALETFASIIADPSAPRVKRDATCRRLGASEFYEGRSLDSLQAAYRTGMQVAWRRARAVAKRHDIPADLVGQLAETIFAYGDELAAMSEEGYREAERRSGRGLAEYRKKLLRRILDRPAVPEQVIAELAASAQWRVPAEVTLIATEPGPGLADSLDEDMLASPDQLRPCILVPGHLDERRLATLQPIVASLVAAAGPTMPLRSAADSLRWARQALQAAKDGFIPADRLIRCDDHLVTLWLRSDPALVGLIAERHFPALRELPADKSRQLLDTFAAWLEQGGKAAVRLRVHPQTVRYRLKLLKDVLGTDLTDPDEKFALELVTRAMLSGDAGGDAGADGGAEQK
jgi:PucR-like helix-turn-helix protein